MAAPCELYRRDLTGPQRRVLDRITEWARQHTGEWVGLPPEYKERSSWASAQRRVACRLVRTGKASALEGLCVKVGYGSTLIGWFESCQPECLYRGQTQHARTFGGIAKLARRLEEKDTPIHSSECAPPARR
jgi:hypothetical protein